MARPKITAYRAKDGEVTYRFRLTITRPDGTRHQMPETSGFRTERDADRALTKMLAQRDETGKVAGATRTKETVGQFLERWVKTLNTDEPRGAQLAHMAKYLIPLTLNDRLWGFGPTRVGELYQDIRKHGRVRGSAPLNGTTMTHVAKTLSLAMQAAVTEELIPRNPCVAVPEKPRQQKREMKAWKAADAEAFVRAAFDAELYFAWLLMLARGMRPGEVAGLRSSDFFPDQMLLSVQRAWVAVDGAKPYLSDGKSFRSARTISLDPVLVDAYRRYMLKRYEWKQQAGEGWVDNDWLFVWPTTSSGPGRWGDPHRAGSPYNPRVIRERFQALCKRVGLPPIRQYDLRHTAASLLLLSGTHVKIVAEMLGNDPAVTMRTYQHVTQNMHAAAGADLTGIVFGKAWEADVAAMLAADNSAG